MRRATVALLTATTALTLAGCGGGGGQPAAHAAAATTSSPAPTSASASASVTKDDAAQLNCLTAGLAYVPLTHAVQGSDSDLLAELNIWRPATYKPTSATAAGAAANAGLAKIDAQAAAMKAQLAAGQQPDRPAFEAAYLEAGQACAAVGAHL